MKSRKLNYLLISSAFILIPGISAQANTVITEPAANTATYQCANVVNTKPFSKIYFSERTQYRTAKRSFLERLMFSGVVLQDGWMKNMYWSVETDADLGEHFDQWKNSY